MTGGVQTLDAGSRQSAFVAAYDSNGLLQHAGKLGGGYSYVAGSFLDLDAAGNIYLTGSMSNGSGDFDPGPGVYTLSNGSGNNDTYIVKLDGTGRFVWASKFTNDPTIAAGVWPHDISVDASQNVFVSGIFVGRTDFDPGSANHTLAADGGSTTQRSGDGYVARLNADGSLGYAIKIGSSTRREDTYGVVADASGNAFITGTTNYGGAIYGTGGTVPISSAGSNDAYLARLNAGGAVDWAYRLGSSGSDGGSQIELASDGSVFLAGYYANTVDFDRSAGVATLTSSGNLDPFLLQTDRSGNFLEVWGVGSSSYDFPDELFVAPSGDIVMAGRFTASGDFELGPAVQTLTPVGGTDMFVSKLERVAPNEPPTASDGTLTVDEDTTGGGILNAVDPEGAALSYQLADTSNAHGTVTLNAATGQYSYVPDANFHGAASFTFTASDGSQSGAPGTIRITVNAVEDAPVAHDGSLTVSEDGSVLGHLVGTDGDGDALTYEIVDDQNAQGTVSLLNADTGAIRYTPLPDYNGTASFTYRVNDGDQSSNVATILITVLAEYDPPVASNGHLDATEDTPTTGVLTAENVDGSHLRFRLMDTSGARGSVQILNASTGEYSYLPDADYFGPAEFTFAVTDGQTTSTATVSIRVAAVNDAPRIADAAFEIEENSVAGTFVGQVTATDVDDAALTYSITDGNIGDAFRIDGGTGAITVDQSAALDFETTPEFSLTVQVQDAEGATDAATVVVRLLDVAETRTLRIDILPDDPTNRLNSKSKGKVSVAIYGSADFDIRTIDLDSIRFGATGSEDSLSRHKKRGPRISYQDLDGDGIIDLVATFELRHAGFQRGDTEGYFSARSMDGEDLFGQDSVNVR